MTRKLTLGSIEQEAAACRKAFKGVKVGTFVLHCHHEILGERLTEDAENRISFILRSKAQREQALRLHLFRPFSDAKLCSLGKKYPMIKKADAERQKADAELAILVHPHVCKNCTWDGKTIFPKAKP